MYCVVIAYGELKRAAAVGDVTQELLDITAPRVVVRRCGSQMSANVSLAWITGPPCEHRPSLGSEKSDVNAGSEQVMLLVTVGIPVLARLPRVPGTSVTP